MTDETEIDKKTLLTVNVSMMVGVLFFLNLVSFEEEEEKDNKVDGNRRISSIVVILYFR
jgi:hypothetical protein